MNILDGTLDSCGNRSILLSFPPESSMVYYISDEYWVHSSQTTEIIVESSYKSVGKVYILLYQLPSHCLTVKLKQETVHSDVKIYIIFMLKRDQKLEINVIQNHSVCETSSTVKVRGIVADYASNLYEGTITIDSKAFNVEAVQEHKTLLLGSHARVVSKPILQVLHNQVRCKHGAAVGRCDDTVLFYMQSRGFSLRKARMLSVGAFLQQLLKEGENAFFSESIVRVLDQMIV